MIAPMRRARLLGVLGVVSAGLVACSLVVDTSGLGGGSGPRSDAGALVEASADAPGLGSDAGADASVKRPAPTWSQAADRGPPGRHSMGMAFDGVGLVMFGGTVGQNVTVLADTWRWDGTTWSTLTPPQTPRPRYGHTIVERSSNGVWMLSGRHNDSSNFAWDGTTWSALPGGIPIDPTTQVAFDSDRKVAVVLDVDGAAKTLRHWEYDGGGWRQLPGAVPSFRRGGRMVYDSARKRVVLFGGRGNPEPLADTWEFDGATWTARTTPTSPPGRQGFCMTFDPSRGVTVAFGGAGGTGVGLLGDTWEWDGTTWTEGPPGPPKRRSCAMGYDPVRRRVVLFGGVYGVSGDGGYWNGARTDTWLY